jgi:hypothetical protein
MRVERLEATTGKGVQNALIVFSYEEAEAAREVLGPDGIVMHVQFIAPGGGVVPYDYHGQDYAWRIRPPLFLRSQEIKS